MQLHRVLIWRGMAKSIKTMRTRRSGISARCEFQNLDSRLWNSESESMHLRHKQTAKRHGPWLMDSHLSTCCQPRKRIRHHESWRIHRRALSNPMPNRRRYATMQTKRIHWKRFSTKPISRSISFSLLAMNRRSGKGLGWSLVKILNKNFLLKSWKRDAICSTL